MITIIYLLIPYVNIQDIQVLRIELKIFSLNNFQIQLNNYLLLIQNTKILLLQEITEIKN